MGACEWAKLTTHFFYSTARLVLLPAPKLRVPSRAALDASCAVASRVSRLSVSERCCASSCCACQIEPSYNRHTIHLAFTATLWPRSPPIHSASSLPPTPFLHDPRLAEHPFERERRRRWWRRAHAVERRGRAALQPRCGGDEGMVSDRGTQQLWQSPIEQQAY